MKAFEPAGKLQTKYVNRVADRMMAHLQSARYAAEFAEVMITEKVRTETRTRVLCSWDSPTPLDHTRRLTHPMRPRPTHQALKEDPAEAEAQEGAEREEGDGAGYAAGSDDQTDEGVRPRAGGGLQHGYRVLSTLPGCMPGLQRALCSALSVRTPFGTPPPAPPGCPHAGQPADTPAPASVSPASRRASREAARRGERKRRKMHAVLTESDDDDDQQRPAKRGGGK